MSDNVTATAKIASPYSGALIDAVGLGSSEHPDQGLVTITVGEATIIALVVVCTIMLLTLNLCYQQCRRNQKTMDDLEASKVMPEDRTLIKAAEVRPGLVLVHGSPNQEETMRIVNEYDAMMANAKSENSMFTYPYRDQPPNYVQFS